MQIVPYPNYSVVILTPKLPFTRWLKALPADENIPEDDDGDDRVAAFLVPASGEFSAMNDLSEVQRFVLDHHGLFFEHSLRAFCEDENRWPTGRTRITFANWFHIRVQRTVVEVVGAKRHPWEG